MDLTWAIEALGESWIAGFGGLVVGMMFGAFAQRSRFCLRSAVIEFAEGAIGLKVAIWLLTFSVAVAGVQGLTTVGFLDVSETRQLAARGSMSGALVGGTLFGIGMILARGCASRLLVLSATGNLRALLSGLIFAVTAQAAYQGMLAPLRDAIGALWIVEGGPSRDLAATLGLGATAKVVAAAVWLSAALLFAWRNRLSLWSWLGGAGAGAAVAAAWFFTFSLSQSSFDPVPISGITLSGPSAEVLMLVLSPPGKALNFDIGIVPGVFLGSFLAAALAGELELVGFKDGLSMPRYIAGAVLMGFGAMLAGGCAVGAGVSGGAIFSLTAWLALTAMWAAAGVTHALIDRTPRPAATTLAPALTVGEPAPYR